MTWTNATICLSTLAALAVLTLWIITGIYPTEFGTYAPTPDFIGQLWAILEKAGFIGIGATAGGVGGVVIARR